MLQSMTRKGRKGNFMTKTSPKTAETRKSLKKELTSGPIQIIRPSKLATEGRTGVVARGVYEGAQPNKFNADKSDYFVRGADGTLYIINETASLKDQFSSLTKSDLAEVEVVYGGKKPTKKGKSFHEFEVFVIG